MTKEEAAQEYAQKTSGGFKGTVMENLIAEIFIAGAEWQKQQSGWKDVSELTELVWISYDIVVKIGSKLSTNDQCDYEDARQCYTHFKIID